MDLGCRIDSEAIEFHKLRICRNFTFVAVRANIVLKETEKATVRSSLRGDGGTDGSDRKVKPDPVGP